MGEDLMRVEFSTDGVLILETGGVPAVTVVQELLDNGQATTSGGAVRIAWEEVLSLDRSQQDALGLPKGYPFELVVRAHGTLNEATFTFDLRFQNFVGGEDFLVRRSGPIVHLGDAVYLLSRDQFLLCSLVETFSVEAADTKTFRHNLETFGRLKALAASAAAHLDDYLASEQALLPEIIKLDVKPMDNGDYLLVPEVPDLPKFSDKFDQFPRVRDTYNFEGPDGSRVRVPLAEGQHRELEKVKAQQRLTRDNLAELAESPQDRFNPEIIDLNSFSQRVYELGVYKPRFYPFVSPYRSQWIPGFIVERGPEERIKVTIATPAELEEIRQAFVTALRTDQPHVKWRDIEIPTDRVDEIIKVASKQFAQPKEPVTTVESGTSLTDKRVLLIKENIESVDFTTTNRQTEITQYRFSVPTGLDARFTLLPHQREAIGWMQTLIRGGISGALLADDMGLGKTLQALSVIAWHYTEKNRDGNPYLVVAPVTLLENWAAETAKFFPNLGVAVRPIHGETARAAIQQSTLQRTLCLTTYETLRNRQREFCAIDWSVAILDEAQKVKTPGSLITNAVKALKAGFLVALTGTPVENSYVDLWCIMDACVPGLLGSAKEFAKEFQAPLRRADVDIPALGQKLHRKIGEHMRRRLKQDILTALPPKRNHQLRVEMTPIQRRRYESELQYMKQARSGEDGRGKALESLRRLRRISDHPFLGERSLDAIPLDEAIAVSGKLSKTVSIIDDIRRHHEKVILFTDDRDMQRLLARTLREAYSLPNVHIINGDTPASASGRQRSKLSRQQAVDDFQRVDGFSAIVLSPLAAGIGLNITEANHVIHYSRHWNPAKEAQATDRAHRIGQTKEVHVYYPMSTCRDFKSFDEILDELLGRKSSLATATLYPSEMREVVPEEIMTSLDAETTPISTDELVCMPDADNFEPHLFEAFCGALMEKRGFTVKVTPKTNDKGVDLVCLSAASNLLVQVKQSRFAAIQDNAIDEIVKGRAHFERMWKVSFEVCVMTNGIFNGTSRVRASEDRVRLIDGTELAKMALTTPVLLSRVQVLDRERL